MMSQVPNPSDITSKLATMSNQQLAQFAQMHKNDPYMLPLASAEDARRKAIRQGAMAGKAEQQPTVADQAVDAIAQDAQPQQVAAAQLPEETGIAPLAAPNIQGMADGGIAGYAGGTQAFDVDAYMNNPNVQKYLAYLNAYEGRPKPNQLVGYKSFDDLSDHPGQRVRFGKAKNQVSTAAGSYQILKRSWDEQKKKLGLEDFSLENQQRAAIGLLKDSGALKHVAKGEFQKANEKAKNIWASLPGSTIGEETGQRPRVKPELEAALGKKEGIAALAAAPARAAKKEEKFGLSPDMAQFFNKFMPGSEARAGELPMSRAPVANGTAGVTQLPVIPEAKRSNTVSGKVNGPAVGPAAVVPVSQVDQIPVDNPKYQVTPPKPEPENKLLRAGKDVLGAPEAIMSTGFGAISPLTHLIPKGIAAVQGTPITDEQAINMVVPQPYTDVGKGSLENLNRAFEDFKIPPFIPGVGSPRAKRVGPAMEAEAAAARAAAEQAKGKVENVRLPPPEAPAARPAAEPIAIERQRAPEFPLQDAALEMQREARLRKERQALNDLAKDKNEAKTAETKAAALEQNAKSGSLLDEVMRSRALEDAKRNAFTRNLGRAELGAKVAEQTTTPPAAVKRPYEAFEEGFTAPETNYQLPKPETATTPAAPRADTQKFPLEKKEGFGLTDEDWLNLGLGLLSGGPREGNALQDLLAKTGKAGISALGARKEREKAALAKEHQADLREYYKSLKSSPNERIFDLIKGEMSLPEDQRVNLKAWQAMNEAKSTNTGQITAAEAFKIYNTEMSKDLTGDFKSRYPDFETFLATAPNMKGASVTASAAGQIDPNAFKLLNVR
jgi:lysozyme